MQYPVLLKVGFYAAIAALIVLLYVKKRKQKHDIDNENNKHN